MTLKHPGRPRKMPSEELPTDLPKAVRLSRPHAFYDDDNVLHTFPANTVIRSPENIKILAGTTVEVVDDD